MKSLKVGKFDYEDENLDYFYSQLQKINVDVICVQENHSNNKRNVAGILAKKLGYKYIYNSQASPSHIDSNYQLGNSIISRVEFSDVKTYTLPYPEFELYFRNGSKSAVHDKVVQLVSVSGTDIANTQLLPLGLFGSSYSSGIGNKYATKINKVFRNLEKPLIFCGDFSGDIKDDNVIAEFPGLRQLSLLDALPDVKTRPISSKKKKKPDHILYSEGFDLVESDVVKTQTDHCLCYAEFKIK